MSEQKHTPLPWKAGPYSSIVGIAISAQPDPNKNRVVVAGTTGAFSDDHKGEHEANAALIVRAVNSHEALVKAVSDMLEMIEEGAIDSPEVGVGCGAPQWKVHDEWAHYAKNALASAKGENNE